MSPAPSCASRDPIHAVVKLQMNGATNNSWDVADKSKGVRFGSNRRRTPANGNVGFRR
jgi:hypothetical protein